MSVTSESLNLLLSKRGKNRTNLNNSQAIIQEPPSSEYGIEYFNTPLINSLNKQATKDLSSQRGSSRLRPRQVNSIFNATNNNALTSAHSGADLLIELNDKKVVRKTDSNLVKRPQSVMQRSLLNFGEAANRLSRSRASG